MTTTLSPERREQLARVVEAQLAGTGIHLRVPEAMWIDITTALHAEIAGEYEARIEDHRVARRHLAGDLIALADGEKLNMVTAHGEAAWRRMAKLDAERDAALARIADLEATIAAGPWIPTAERLPAEGERVLICSGCAWFDMARLEEPTADGDQWFEVDGWGRAHPAEMVTHWMPLPKLPGEETP